MNMKRHKLNNLNSSLVAVLSATLLASCGGGGGGGSSYTSTTTASGSTALSTVSVTQLTAATTGVATADTTTATTNLSFNNASETVTSSANLSYTQTQTANNQTFTNSHTAVSQTYFTGWPNSTSNAGVAASYNNLFAMGLIPVVSGQSTINFYIPVTGASTETFNASATFSTDASNFRGAGVNVGIIDGSLNTSHTGLNASNFTVVNIANQYTGNPEADVARGVSLDHGTRVSLILAGQRNSTYNGLVPDASVYYNVLTQYTSNHRLGDIYTTMYTYRPAVINNSYSISYTEESETSEDQFGQVHATAYASALAGLKTVTANADTPLFVFSSANADFYSWLQTQVESDANASSSTDWSSVYYGPQLDTNSSLYQFINADENIANALLVVTGYSLNVDGNYANLLNATKNAVVDTGLSTTGTGSAAFSADLFVPGVSGSSSDLNNVSVAYQCGVTKWNCLAGAYLWEIANYSSAGSFGFAGTSASAPQVTAIAAMVKEQFDWMTAKQLKTTLLTTAYDIGEAGVDSVFGWGVVDASVALNGPGAFVFGDFEANISNTNKRYWFNNNITGAYGLVVNGTSNLDQLVLTGANNTYSGDTVVNGGALVIQDQSSAGFTTANVSSRAALVNSHVYINSDGNFYAYNANLSNVTNNGYTQFYNVSLTGNLVNKYNATLATSLTNPINIAGNASLNGTLYIQNVDSYVTTGSTNNVSVLTAKNITGNFENIVSDYANSALVSYSLLQNSTAVLVSVNASNASTYVNSVSLSGVEAQAYAAGASQVDKLFAAANSQATTGVVAVTGATEVNTSESVVTESTNLVFTSSYYSDLANISEEDLDAVSLTSVGTGSTTSAVVLTADDTSSATDSSSTVTTASTSDTATSSSDTSASTTDTTTTSDTTASTADTTTSTRDSATSTSDSEVVAAAASLQSLTASELNEVLLRASGTIYSNLLQATTQQARSHLLTFADQALGRFATLDNQWHAYVDFGYRWQDWKSNATSLKGHLDSNAYTIGAYTQTLTGYNLGIAAYSLNGNWDEGTAASDYTAGAAKVKSFGFSASVGKAFANSYYGATLYSNFHNFDVTRSVLDASDQKVEFNAQTFGLDLSAGWLVLGSQTSGVILSTGVTAEATHQNAFTETATNSASQTLSLDAKARWTSQLYAHAGIKAFAQFRTFGYASQVDASLKFSGKVAGQDFKLRLTDGTTTGQVFNNDFLARLNLGYSVNLTNSLRIRLAGSVEKSSAWTEKAVNLGLDFKF
ncbi:hypothetical protein CJP74_06900 [Psittacicella melopsittaci]|uniref:Autotransporter domain-containing protein n=1 Tax=Psittacicella melopsittaci TaxID=2028576 RepID=A0A3A1Y6D1_9GAMM|nr:S8 family serine peptidase [Psittacicella melopsittaci]RIY31614.1 hypothetical protein CJP74_06900 [Psittacicella melopsittaci]